ncbi:Haloacid dehalogenase-like hydrolase (HAD) superfamily protein, partial [Striga hermonthica]
FKRPYCDDFLKFCFQNFDVGIWSSRSKKLIDLLVEFLLGDLQEHLLFCWVSGSLKTSICHGTKTVFTLKLALENYNKPLVLKDIRKIWESDGPNLRWKKGQYNETNTLLLDDSPYKALLNPLHTAIFPKSYSYKDNKSDNSL